MATTDISGTTHATTAVPGFGSRKAAWGFTALVVALYVVNWGDKAVLGLVAQDLKDEIGINEEQIGLIASAFFIMTTIISQIIVIARSASLSWINAANDRALHATDSFRCRPQP